MNSAKETKLLLYRFFTSKFGGFILRMFSFGVSISDIGNRKKQKKHPFLVAITVDTESGYVDANERRIWQKEEPNAFVGYYHGIKNLADIFEKYGIKATFFLSTQCFSSKDEDYKKIKNELDNILSNGYEIGLHLHPDSDFALQKKMSKKFKATSAFFYSFKEKLEIIKAAKDIVKEHLGDKVAKELISFRWGNWALDADGVKALHQLGFKVDSSAIPGIKGHLYDGMIYDWNKVKRHYPWKLSIIDHQETRHNNSNVVEMPIATFSFFGIKLRADPVNSVLLNKAFLKYHKKVDISIKPFPFVVMTHSSEATTKNGGSTQALKDLDNFISFAMKFKDVEFVTLKEAYQRLKQ